MSVYKLVLAEGGAERAVLDILLDNELTHFTRDNIVDNKVFQTLTINGEVSKQLNLMREDGNLIEIIRIVDAPDKPMRIPREYKDLIRSITDYVTKPEIEMLIIINEGDYVDYQKYKSGKRKLKPSEYSGKYGYNKSYTYWKNYWHNTNMLVNAVKTYDEKSDKSSKTLFELLR